MLRRSVLACLASSLLALAGCSQKPVQTARDDRLDAHERRDEAVRFMRVSIEYQAPDQGVTFIPAIISLLLPFLCQMLIKCALAQVLKQHRAINRNPDGAIALRWKASVAAEFQRQHAGVVPPEEVAGHVAAVFEAFREASERELTETVEALQAVPSESDWDAAGLVRQLVED